jgi:3-phosphoshikimate 1-carboxyvinyltransferase
MAMAFAPLATLFPVEIDKPEVVKKSYPNYWNDLKTVGIQIN